MLLVSWIAKRKRSIELLSTYADNSFGPDLADNLLLYPLYHKFMPANQVKLLQLWDEINLLTKRANRSSDLYSPL